VTLIQSLLFLAVPSVLLAYDWNSQELEYALTLTKCSHLFVDPEYLPLVIPVAEKFGIPHHNVKLLRDPGQEEAHGHFGKMMDRVKSANLPQANVHPANNDTIAYFLFTSGTTGIPKGQFLSASCSYRSSLGRQL
jgi:long-subunit acyl-CoA synthetase (AMP-forming)